MSQASLAATLSRLGVAHDGGADQLAAEIISNVLFGSSLVVPSWRKVTDAYVSGGAQPGAVGDGVAIDGPAIAYWMSQAPTGGVVYAPAGSYRVRQGFTFPGNGVTLLGDGAGCTKILVDDSLGNIGDVFTLTNRASCAIKGLTIDAMAPRAAGRAIYVQGGDATKQLALGICRGGHVFDVDMNNQFKGIQFDDNGALGDFGSVIGSDRDAYWSNMAAGAGFGIFFNTPHGASQIIQNVFIDGAAGATGPAVWYRGSGDVTLKHVQTFGMGGGGWVFDPQANCAVALDVSIQMTDCQWDSIPVAATPNMLWTCGPAFNAAGCVVFAQLTNNWIAGATGDGMKVTGPGLRNRLYIDWKSGACYLNGGFGINVTDTLATVLDDQGNPQINVLIASSTNGPGGSALTNTTLGIPFRGNPLGQKSFT